MVELPDLPHRPLTEAELIAFRDEQDIECRVGYFAFCSHCDIAGVTDALVRDGRQVYVLHHGWDDWELNMLEEDFDPRQFQVMAEQMKCQAGLLRLAISDRPTLGQWNDMKYMSFRSNISQHE